MAIFDWNHNGKNDLQDDFLEFQIYQDYLKKRKEGGYSSAGSTGCGTAIITVIVIIVILGIIALGMEACTPRCIAVGCDNKRTDGSSYCSFHEDAARRNRYSSPSGYSSYGSSNHNYSGGSSSSGTSSYSGSSYSDTSSYSAPSTSDTSSYSKPSTSGTVGGSGGGKLYSNTGSSSSSKSYSGTSSSEKKEKLDPYGAKDYPDAEDFYYDNYDDFESYEDAETYYDDVMDE